MKIQELAIIFVIIILPISLLLSEYTQAQIQTISLQTEYDTRLTTATYDAIKAFQLNTKNESLSDIANQKLSDLEASINSFRNSLKSAFKLNGYTEEELNNYIPALVYTLYDGFYMYSPYENVNYQYEPIKDAAGNVIGYDEYRPIQNNGENIYGLKPYINYSCRYVKNSRIDVVITYALDNHITVQGMINDVYVNKSGYLIDNITVTGNNVSYNGVTIEKEQLKENVGNNTFGYVKLAGTKYYLMPNYKIGEDEYGTDIRKDCIVSILNGIIKVQCTREDDEEKFNYYKGLIENNISAQTYYKNAKAFTDWFKSTGLDTLTYADAYDEVINQTTKQIDIAQPWAGNNTPIFDFNSGTNPKDNIENKLSNFNQHRLAVIRHKIETNLAIAISNYNEYSGAATTNVFQMPELKENEWDYITNNISVISFLQGLHIGGKVYNGYSIVTNSESEEVVLEENIYILGTNDKGNNIYCRIGDLGLENGTVTISTVANGKYGGANSVGRLNLDFNRAILTNGDSDSAYYYYYPLKDYNASYSSVVMQTDTTAYDDIYEYVNGQSVELKQVFYTALGRERASQYNYNVNY